MWSERHKQFGKILLLSLGAYIISFFLVFGLGIFFGVEAISNDARPIHKYIVGPMPLFCEGTYARGAANGEILFTGKEWPFVVYRPLVILYNHWQVPIVEKIDKELEEDRKTYIR